MKGWIKWLLLSVFLLVLGVIQFIPGNAPPSTPVPADQQSPAADTTGAAQRH